MVLVGIKKNLIKWDLEMNSKLNLKNILRTEGMIMNLSSIVYVSKKYSFRSVIFKTATKSQQFVGYFRIFFQYPMSTYILSNKFRSFNNLNIKKRGITSF